MCGRTDGLRLGTAFDDSPGYWASGLPFPSHKHFPPAPPSQAAFDVCWVSEWEDEVRLCEAFSLSLCYFSPYWLLFLESHYAPLYYPFLSPSR